jgi:hypothetical protein
MLKKKIMTVYKKITFFFGVLLLGGGLLVSSSCKKILGVTPQQTLDYSGVYQNISDADAAVVGLYGQFLSLAKQYVLLNELRADLMSVTPNSDKYLQQLNTHSVTTDNPYADPRPFYSVILNCNDILYNFNIMVKAKKMNQDQYNQRYSDVLALRTWIYLQLGIQFGTIPYVTNPLMQVSDLSNPANFTSMSLSQLLPLLLKTMQSLPYMADYTLAPNGTLPALISGYSTQKMFINKYCLLGDLYLWNGQYTQAATTYRIVMEYGTNNYTNNSAHYFNMYKVPNLGYQTTTLTVHYGNGVTANNNLPALIDANNDGWRSIFARSMQDNDFNEEWLWALPFDGSIQPRSPLLDLFSDVNGSWLVQPSQIAINNWNSQIQQNNFPFDARGLFSWRMIAGKPVIMKYLYNYVDPITFQPIALTANSGQDQSKWFLYRAADLHLHFAEAANRDGRHKLAYALVNEGILTTYTDSTSAANNTNTQQTFDQPPYDFDARNGTPIIHENWYRNTGIRGRAFLKALPVTGDSTLAIEDQVISESALELAYEGNRWADLVRVSLRRNDPSYLANRIYNKLVQDGNGQAAAVRAKLMNQSNWFLPFKLQ